ncbi:MAG TPA: outer membrane protein transport protein [Thermoanaerobaculia bacterium]|nr:outer membrane protein transport protein [Thermoanaerobaculia bacterium]
MVCVVTGASAFGAGFSIFEQGAKASGMAGAYVATADDPSAIFYNPAGIAQQRELSVLAGATFINFTNEFTGDPNSEYTSGTTGQYARHTFVPPNVYATLPIGSNLTVGVGTFAAFGLRTDWEDPWVGRFLSRDADLKTVSVQPTVAWQSTNGHIAVGAGVEYRRARVILNQNIALPFLNPFTGRVTDVGNARLASDYGSDIGWNVGVLFKPSDRLRFGASYRTDMDIELDGDADFTQISTGNAQLDAAVAQTFPHDDQITTVFPFPAIAAVGVAFSPSERVDVEFDITHMTWSRFEALDVQFVNQPARSFVREQNWDDSSAYRLGANIAATPAWDVRLGAVYDENPQPVEAVSPLLPDSDRIGATIGAGYHHGPFIVDGALFVLHFKDRSTQGRNPEGFDGTYETDAVLWSFNLGYRF